MGINISSKLLVGRYAEDILETRISADESEEEMELDETDWLEDLGLEYASRYYDCDPLDCVWGIEIGDGSVEDTIAAIKEAEADFFNLTGLIPRVYQLPNVY